MSISALKTRSFVIFVIKIKKILSPGKRIANSNAYRGEEMVEMMVSDQIVT